MSDKKNIISSKKQFGEILTENGILDAEDLKKALSLQKKSNAKLGQILLNKGLVSEEDLLYTLSTQYQLEFFEKLEVKNIETLKTRVSLKFVQKYRIVPYSLEDTIIRVAMTNPEQIHPLDELRMLWIGYDIIVVLTPESEIIKIINNFYERNTKQEDGEEESFGDDFEFLDDIQDLSESMDLANEAPIIKMVNIILTNAINERASDIHIEPQEKELWVRYRVDGILHRVLTPPKAIQNGIISRIKIMGNMNIAENRLPQDGRIKIRFGGKDVDIRVSSIPSQFGEMVVMRLLNKTDTKYEMTSLGMDEEEREKYKALLKKPNGLILITGPTGSGKSSTLYASLNVLNEESRNIITIEDPVEYQMNGINQIQTRSDIGLTFAEGLRSMLRQDPDIIMVGEIRDEETARVSIQASLTGHLVFSSLHTNDAPSAVTRLIDMGIENYLVTSTCLSFMAQRLLRVLCPACKKKTNLTLSTLQKLGYKKRNKEIAKNFSVYEAQGCKLCMDIGYQGRIGIYELLVMDNELRECIIENQGLEQLRKLAHKQGMRTLREAALKKVLDGISSIEEAMRVT